MTYNAKNCADFSGLAYAPFRYLANIENFTFGPEVERIPSYLCIGLTSLTSIIIPNSVTEIGEWAFAGCAGLASVTIPNSVTSIGNEAFAGCTNLKNLVVESGNSIYDSRENCNAIIETATNTLICGCKNTHIPNSVTEIGEGAFYCSGLTNITIPNSVTSIGNEAFEGCSELKSITIPNSVTSIGYRAFAGCTGLTNVTIPNSVTSIGDYAFALCSELKSITIPNSVTSIGNEAFAGCTGLTSIVSLPMIPPTLGSDCFSGVSNDIPVYVTSEALYDYAENSHWSAYFFNFFPIGDNKVLTVNLPSDASDGRYKDMYIMVESADSTSHNRCVITNNVSYSFHVSANKTYNISVITANGSIAAERQGVAVGEEDTTVSFQSILQPRAVSMAVTLPDDEDITDRINITWTDEKGEFLGQGSVISGLLEAEKVNYELKLPQDLALTYVQPERQGYLVRANGNSLLHKLQPFGKAIVSGTVTDATTGRPIYRASVTVTQLLNGSQDKSFSVLTDTGGGFTSTVLEAPGNIIVNAQGFVTKQISIESVNSNISLGNIALEPITGVVISTSLAYRNSVRQGDDEPGKVDYEDYRNISFSIHNRTQNCDIVNISVQYPSIVLLDDVADGDEIIVGAHSLNGTFADTQTSCTVTDNRADAELQLVQLGGIEATYSQSECEQVMGLLYDINGEIVLNDNYVNGSLNIPNLQNGTYTLISIQKNDRVAGATSLSSLDQIGLRENTHYCKNTINVNDGIICEVNVDKVPSIDGSLLNFTGSSTAIYANKSDVTIGNYEVLTANIDFKKAYIGKTANVRLCFELPDGCDFVDGSVLTDGKISSYYIDGNMLDVIIPDNGGQVKFCVIPSVASVVKIGAVAHFLCDGEKSVQSLGAATFNAKALDLNAPSITSSEEIAISGFAPFNTSINVFDGDKLIGTTNTGASGTWNLTCTLSDTYMVSAHELQAHATTPQGKELLSEVATCFYDKNHIEPLSITMIYRNYKIVFYPMQKRTEGRYYSYVPGSPAFTFLADFNTDQPDKLLNVNFNVLASDGKIRAFPAMYDEANGKWVARAEFDNSNSLPVNVNVTCDVITDVQKDLSPNLLADMKYVENRVSEAMNIIPEKFTQENCTYDDEHVSYDLTSQEFGLNYPCEIRLLNYDEIVLQMDGDNEFIEIDNDGKHIWVKIWEDDNAIHSIYINKEERKAISYDILMNGRNNILTNGRQKIAFIAFALPFFSEVLTGYGIRSQTIKAINRLLASADNSLKQIRYLTLLQCPDGTYLFDFATREQIFSYVYSGNDELNSITQSAHAFVDSFKSFIGKKIAIGTSISLAMMGLPLGAIGSEAGKVLAQFGIGKLFEYIHNDLFEEKSYNEFVSEFLSVFSQRLSVLENNNIQFIKSLNSKKRNCDNEEVVTSEDFDAQSASPSVDPSGFVYEAVKSNRLPGVTATIYYKETVEDMWGNPHEEEVLWNAEEYAQKNPLFTDENGMYQWDVPKGLWQVRFNKNGYEPTQSEWLPVPPPQLDVNIGMTQLRQPEVEMVHAYVDGVDISFDKYMLSSTLTTDNIKVSQAGIDMDGYIELIQAETEDGKSLVQKVRFVPNNEFTAKQVTLTVENQVESYAGVPMNSRFEQTFDIEQRVRVIAIDSLVNVGYGESRRIPVQVFPSDVSSNKILNVISSVPIIADVKEEQITLNKSGKAEIEVYGNIPGATTLVLDVEGFDLRQNAVINVVDESLRVAATPVASVVNGMVFNDNISVSLSCETPGAKIYYTTNGTCPCDEDERMLYEGPITINETTTLKAIAVASGYYESDIATYYYFLSSSVGDILTDSPLRITPTIVTDGFSVKGINETCEIRVYSLSGSEILHKKEVYDGERVSLIDAPNGVYIVVAIVNDRPYAVRIMKVS